MNNEAGTLEVAMNNQGQVVVNFDRDRVGHIVFSAQQARDFGSLLLKKAVESLSPDGIYRDVAVSEAKGIAERYEKSLVLIIAWDSKHGLSHTTTYGVTAFDKENAAAAGEICSKALGCDLGKKIVYQDYHKSYSPALFREAVEMLRSIAVRGVLKPQESQEIICKFLTRKPTDAPTARWTKEPPTEAGWYWHYSGDYAYVRLLQVVTDRYESLRVHFVGRQPPVKTYGGLWLKVEQPAPPTPEELE